MGALTQLRSPRSSSQQEVYLSPAQVCELVPGMTERRLRGMRAEGTGPRYFKPSLKTVVYAEADVRAWVKAHLVTTREQN